MSLTKTASRDRSHAATARRAASLIEMVAVMGANVVLIGAALSMLTTYIRADHQLAARDDRALQLAPMMHQVRNDLHAAQAAHFDDQTLTLQMSAEGEIRYRKRGGAWERRRSLGESNDELAGAYRLPTGSTLAMNPADAAAGELVRLEWLLPAEVSLPNRDPPPAEELVVAVGRDGRLLHP